MIEKFNLLKKIGLFDNVSPPAQTALTPFSLIYAENGRGKTTIAAILRSLATDTPDIVSERKRLGSQDTPHIVVEHTGGQFVFQNGSWSQSCPEVAIFDDAFVADNICSSIDVQTSHRKNLHELILGAQGVALNANLQTQVERIEQHNSDLRLKADAIPQIARGPYKVDAFCDLAEDQSVDAKIEEAERRLAAAKSADAIRNRDGFGILSLPDFDTELIGRILGQSLDSLDQEAVQRVRSHLSSLGDGGEGWVAEGMPRIESVSGGNDLEVCPFCAQDLRNSEIIDHYRAYFSDAYRELKATIRQTSDDILRAHAGEIPAAFERNVKTASQAHEFWKDFAQVPEIDVDTAAVARDWNAAREQVLEHFRVKAASPLEPVVLPPNTLESIRVYRQRISEVTALSESLQSCNETLELVKEQAAADDVAALQTDLAKLKAQKARFDPSVVPRCDAYIAEKAAKSATEALRQQARDALDQYRTQIFPTYEAAINDYLRRFNASFRLGEVHSVNSRTGSTASYCVVINGENVDLTADDGPAFRNTLSAGDRNTLALAFFFASLEQDPNLANKIVVIDDPMTSLDAHRSLCTRQEIIALAARVQQIIVLSHSKPFLCSLWESADRNSSKALRINRSATGSELAEWDVRDDSITENDKNHELVIRYLQAADPSIERSVAHALRPILEAFMRVAYPAHFPPGSMLGRFINVCRQRHGGPDEILSLQDTNELRALLDYGNRFHHDSNPAWQTAVISDAELSDFARRTLLFSSRR